ncbi:siderophore-interacting protein [Micrococcales bacterium 31B]|nr:siderophore-interacting protein [Micrococcales bacterium 31B]
MNDPDVPTALFRVRVADIHRLSPRFIRLTFDGADLANFAYDGADQRVRLLLPNPQSGELVLPDGPNWRQGWLDLPHHVRPIVRTYTIRGYRSKSREMDIDFVVHDNQGPVSAFVQDAHIGDEVGLIGPNGRYSGKRGGFEFAPPSKSCQLLLVGDETSVPAVGAIIERLPWDARGLVLLEVPQAHDALDFRAPSGLEVRWLPREVGAIKYPRGAQLLQALRGVMPSLFPNGNRYRDTLPYIDVDEHLLWDVPNNTQRPRRATLYTWVATEARVLDVLRRYLVSEHGIDRRTTAFMGYWRDGIASHDVSIRFRDEESRATAC